MRQQMERADSADLHVNQRGRKVKLTQQDMEAIDALVQKHPDFTSERSRRRFRRMFARKPSAKRSSNLDTAWKRRAPTPLNRASPM